MTEYEREESVNLNLCTTKKIIVWSMVLHLLAGCAATSHSHTDVSSPSDRELVEFDALVDLPFPIAYQNMLHRAPSYWCSPFSGQILTYAGASAQDVARISFAVPSKFLGSRVELASVRLYPQNENRTRIVGLSFVYPGTWNLTELTSWANAVPGPCTVAPTPA